LSSSTVSRQDVLVERPETRFAWRGDVALAYQVLGSGDVPLLYLQGWPSNVELNWDHETMAGFLLGLSRSHKLIVMDARGNGCSERGTPQDVWPLETIMEDAIAVLDAAQVERAAIFARHHLGLVACMFAASFPERVAALILNQTTANFLWSEETPWELTEELWRQYEEQEVKYWGTRTQSAAVVAARDPSVAGDSDYIDWWHRYTLLSEAPGSTVAHVRKYIRADIRSILPSIHVPTLVFRRREATTDGYAGGARYLAERIPGARLEELPGRDRSPWVGDREGVVRAIEEFLRDVDRERSELDRVLATVMFTDIVGSTQTAAELGDARWRGVVEQHHSMVRALLERFRGQEVDTTGDGFFATFDGPARAIRCAEAIADSVRASGIEIRAGIHTGECELIDGKVGGITINIGARIAAVAQPSEILVSQTVRDLIVGSTLALDSRGEHQLKGVPGTWHLYSVKPATSPNASG
jgi:class 3 adenylate cyclase